MVGQGPYLRSLDHLGRSSEAKNHKKTNKVKCDGRTDGRTDGQTERQTHGPTKRGVESRSMRLKKKACWITFKILEDFDHLDLK